MMPVLSGVSTNLSSVNTTSPSVKIFTLKGSTNNAGSVRLTTDGLSSATVGNIVTFKSYTTIFCKIVVCCTVANVGTSSASWEFALLARRANATNTVTIINNSMNSMISDSFLSQTSILYSEDLINGGLNITCAGFLSAGPLNWIATVTTTEVG